jgi:hypothetical protein
MPVTALLLTAGALIACYLLARERFDRVAAALATFAVAAGSGVAWYATGSDDPAAAFRLLGGSLLAYGWVRASRGRPPRVRAACAAAGVAGGLAAALVHAEPHGWSGTLGVADVLWSSRGGLLATSPALYLSVIGLALLVRVDRMLAAVGLGVLLLTLLVVASQVSWWDSAWPAPAPFVALTPYFVCGAAAAIDAIGRAVVRRPTLAAGAALAPLVLWNLTLMKAGADATFHLGEPMSFGDVGAAQARALHRWIGHPPAMPANLAYALANGVRPAAYDRLAPSRLLASGAAAGTIDVGERDEPFMGDGWHGAERDGDRSFRWAAGAAHLDAPLDHPADLVVEVIARPYQPPGRGPQQLTLVVNGAPHGSVALPAGWHPATFHVPAPAWRSGVNRLELRFAYDARPSDAGIPDARVLAASVDAVSVRVAP